MWVFLPLIHLPAHKEIDFSFFAYALFVSIWEATCFSNKIESKFFLKLLYYSLFTYLFIMIIDISRKIKLFIPLNNWFHLSKPTHIRENRGTISIKKTEHQWTDAFKLWCWRRLSRIPWVISVPEGWYGEGGERGVQDGEHMYTCGGFMLMYGKTNTIL